MVGGEFNTHLPLKSSLFYPKRALGNSFTLKNLKNSSIRNAKNFLSTVRKQENVS
jgi:hypothetical protein